MLGRDLFEFDHQFFLGLLMLWVQNDAIHRADLDTLGRLIVTDALGAQVRVDLVDLIALKDRAIGAFRFAHIAVDAFVSNGQCHGYSPLFRASILRVAIFAALALFHYGSLERSASVFALLGARSVVKEMIDLTGAYPNRSRSAA